MKELRMLTPYAIHIIELCLDKGYELLDIIPDFEECTYIVCAINRKNRKVKLYDVDIDDDDTMIINLRQ